MGDTGYRIRDTGYRIQDTGYRIQDTGYRIKKDTTIIAKVHYTLTHWGRLCSGLYGPFAL
jgi:hypothetical protein